MSALTELTTVERTDLDGWGVGVVDRVDSNGMCRVVWDGGDVVSWVWKRDLRAVEEPADKRVAD